VHDGSGWTRADLALVAAVAALGAIVGWHFVTPYHSWGDDWAGYVLQSRALGAGTITDEIARNGRLLGSGDQVLGPSAYPWGFPALLWLTGGAPGLELPLLKLVGVVSLAVICATTYMLARFLMGRLPALLAVACGTLQPVLLLYVDQVLSDLPFLAISMTALVVTVAAWRHGMLRHEIRLDLVVAIVVLTLLGYSVRSNGVIIPLVFGLAVMLLVIDGAIARATVLRIGAAAVGCVAALAVAYWMLLPDGSLYALSYLTASPVAMAWRIRFFASESTQFLPLSVLPYALKLAAFAAALVLVSIAVWRHRRIASILLGCCVLHGLLLLVVNFNGSVRYLFPLVPPLFVLVVAGAVHLLRAVPLLRHFDGRGRTVAAGVLLACITVAQLWAAQRTSSHLSTLDRTQGPLSDSAARAFRAAAAAAGDGAQVAFFKPRAYRLITGREAIVVSRPARVAVVPCHLLFTGWGSASELGQVPGSTLLRAGFSERYRNEHFTLLCTGKR
jgi:hypothetical protein